MNGTTYRRYLLAVLTMILAFNITDRLALGLVLQNIKIDLHLSDTQLGLLTGIAFAFFYAIMGIPIARWADRGNRVTIISLTVAAWSIMVALTGRVTNFAQLLLIRSAVGVGEAGCVPPANSLIPDYFSRAERPKATAIYMNGMAVSVIVGYFVAGWLNQLYGWRTMFIILGLPGLVLAALARYTLREPRIGGGAISPNIDVAVPVDTQAAGIDTCSTADRIQVASPISAPSMKEVCRRLWAIPTFRHLVVSFSVASFFGAGLSQWEPAFYIRSYGVSTGQLGTLYAIAGGGMALVGTSLGGLLATRYAPGNERLQFRAIAIVCAAFSVVTTGVYVTRSFYLSWTLKALGSIGWGTLLGPIYGGIQSLVPSRMRAMAIAILNLLSSLIGLGLGPLSVGALSDALHPVLGRESLRYALIALCPGYIWAGWHLWCASRTVDVDIERTREESALENGAKLEPRALMR